MNPTPRLRVILAALTVSLAVPAIAFASAPDEPVALKQGKADKGNKRERVDKDAAQFPMTGEAFMERIEDRLAKSKAHLSQRLEKSKIADEKKAELKKEHEAAATKIRNAAKKAAADDEVTREEAKDVRKIAREARHEARAKHGKAKGDKGKGKGDKGKGKGDKGKGKGDKGKGKRV